MARHGSGDIYLGFEGIGYTMADYFFWMKRGFCVVCQTKIFWDEDADDEGCLCTTEGLGEKLV